VTQIILCFLFLTEVGTWALSLICKNVYFTHSEILWKWMKGITSFPTTLRSGKAMETNRMIGGQESWEVGIREWSIPNYFHQWLLIYMLSWHLHPYFITLFSQMHMKYFDSIYSPLHPLLSSYPFLLVPPPMVPVCVMSACFLIIMLGFYLFVYFLMPWHSFRQLRLSRFGWKWSRDSI
jgi:hypothetical protein